MDVFGTVLMAVETKDELEWPLLSEEARELT